MAARKPEVTQETITPAMAARWLEGNVHNRSLRPARIDTLIGVLERKEWVLNGDAIRFDRNGTLLDGQHRLWAIFESGISAPSIVIRGLTPESQETMDIGARRSLKDTLQVRGYPSATSLAAVINYWWRYQNGYVRQRSARPSIQQGLVVLDENPRLVDSYRATAGVVKKFGIPQGVATAMHYEFHSIDSEDAEYFFAALYDGADLKEGDPIHVFRTWLENHRHLGIDPTVCHALGIKAWNFHRANLKIKRVAWKSTGMNAEEFPKAEA